MVGCPLFQFGQIRLILGLGLKELVDVFNGTDVELFA